MNTIVRARVNGSTVMNGTHTTARCTLQNDFAICAASGLDRNYSNGNYSELIMYKTDVSQALYQEIEQNTMTFWGL